LQQAGLGEEMFDQVGQPKAEDQPGKPLVITIGVIALFVAIGLIYMFASRDPSKDGTYDGTFANGRGKLTLVINHGQIGQLEVEFESGDCSGRVSKYSPRTGDLVWNNRFDFEGSDYLSPHGAVSFRIRGFFGERGRLSGWITMSGPAANSGRACQLSGEWLAARR
jgi:hypothetical protein